MTSSKAAGRRTDQTLRVLWEEREFDGHPFTRLVIANPLWSLRPGFAFYHDESTTPPRDLLLVALRSRSLEHLLSYVTRSREEGTLRLGSGWPEQLTLSKARPVSDVRTNPDFTKLRGRLPGEVSDLGYSDLRRRFESSYAWALTWASVAQGVGGEVFFDPDLAPPTGDVARHLFGLIAVTSSDERGVLFQAYSPIGYSALVTGAGAGVGLALPQALRAHRRKTREDCQVHLRRIGVELALYAADHQGAFPTSLEELRDLLLTRSDEEGLPGDGRWFQCPGRPLGPGIGYEYVPGATLGSPPGRMVAYDREKNHRRGRNVLFADGRVLWFREDVFNQLLRSQREKAADMEKKQPE